MSEDKLNVREMPRKVERLPVVGGLYLGWNRVYSQEPGYFCYVVTYGSTKDGAPERYHGHLLRALRLDAQWLRIESARDMNQTDALATLKDYFDKLAVWPEGN